MLKKFLFLCAGLLAGAGIAPMASAQTVDEIVKRGELVVAIDLTNPPWGFLDVKQEPAGFDPAFAKLRIIAPSLPPLLYKRRVAILCRR